MAEIILGFLQLTFFSLFLILGPANCIFDNVPKFKVICDESGLQVNMSFSKPFHGIVYTEGHMFDPLCSIASESPSLEETLNLPLLACGNYIQGSTLCHYAVSTIVIQQHRLLRTAHDYVEIIQCHLPISFEEITQLAHRSMNQIESDPLLKVKPTLELKLRSDVLNKDTENFTMDDKQQLVISLQDGGIFKDIHIKNCVAHDAAILTKNSSVYQLTNPYDCHNVATESLSVFNINRTEKSLIAYAEVKTFKMAISDPIYITCELTLCKERCTCSRSSKRQMEQLTSIASSRLVKRSVVSRPVPDFSFNRYVASNNFLKATIKVMAEKLMKSRDQPKLEKSILEKRILASDGELNSTYSSDSQDATVDTPDLLEIIEDIFTPQTTSEIDFLKLLPEENFTTFSNIEKHIVNIHNYSEFEFNDTHPDLSSISPMTSVCNAETDDKFSLTPINDTVSSINETTESIDASETNDMVFPSRNLEGHDEDCVPKIRFAIVVIVLGFLVICFVLITIGMCLYMRKEKKKRQLDNFLLYNFY